MFTKLPLEGYLVMLIFLITLTIGYAYEWEMGALE